MANQTLGDGSMGIGDPLQLVRGKDHIIVEVTSMLYSVTYRNRADLYVRYVRDFTAQEIADRSHPD